MPTPEQPKPRQVSLNDCLVTSRSPKYFDSSCPKLIAKLGDPNGDTFDDPSKTTTSWSVQYDGAYFQLFDFKQFDDGRENLDQARRRIRSSTEIEWNIHYSDEKTLIRFCKYLGIELKSSNIF